MTPSKSYLIRALYEWLLDNDVTPYVLVDANVESVMVPNGVATDGKVVLNLAPSAIQQLEMTNEYLSFSARFSGVVQNIYCPMSSVLAIYARENGEGMMFAEEAEQQVEGSTEQASAAGDADKTGKKSKPPGLTIVK
jgi:stringent starvation protein B